MNAIALLPAPQSEATEAPAAVIPSAMLSRSALVAALVGACNIVERRNTIPILSHVLIRECGAGVEVIGTDLDVTHRAVIPCDVTPGFSLTTYAHALRDLLKRVKSDDVTLTDVGEGRASIAMGSATASLQTLPPVDFPDVPKFRPVGNSDAPPVIVNFPIAAGELARALAYVSPAISTEETRYYLNGAYLHFRTHDFMGLRGLCIAATDGHRLHTRSIPALVPTNLPPVIIPRLALAHLSKCLGKRATGNVRVTVKDSLVRFTLPDGTEIYTKTIDGTFPDYERVVPRYNEHRAEVDAEAMAAATNQVASVSTERARGVRYTFEGGKLALQVRDLGAGTESNASIAATTSESCAVEVGLNAGYVLQALQNITGAAVIHLQDAGCPVMITGATDPRGLMVLMPMRV